MLINRRLQCGSRILYDVFFQQHKSSLRVSVPHPTTPDPVFMSGESPPPYSAVVATPFVEYVPALEPPAFDLLSKTGRSYLPSQNYRSATLTASPSGSWRLSLRGKHWTRISKTFATLHPPVPSSNTKNLPSSYARFVSLSARPHISPFERNAIYRGSRRWFGSRGASQVSRL
jgi:hypothetical protein